MPTQQIFFKTNTTDRLKHTGVKQFFVSGKALEKT